MAARIVQFPGAAGRRLGRNLERLDERVALRQGETRFLRKARALMRCTPRAAALIEQLVDDALDRYHAEG